LRHLVRIAREAGVSRFEADILAEISLCLLSYVENNRN
jgi:hypothetical protein